MLCGKNRQSVIRLADLDGIMARIEDEIGPDLPAPQQDGRLFGLRLRSGIQAAWRTCEITKASGNDAPEVCVIESGPGHLPYSTRKLRSGSFPTLDLPQAA